MAAPVGASAAPTVDCSALEQPTREVAGQVAADCDSPVEITEATTETTRAWALPDGKIRQETSAAPVRVQKNGEWLPTDLTLEQQPDGSITPKAHPADLVISGATNAAGAHELATLGEGSEQVAMGWNGPLPEPTLSGDTATYAEVKPGVDLVVQATTRGVESSYIVKTPEAASQVTEWTLPIVGDEVTSHKLDAEGKLVLLDKNKKPVATSPTPLMWDAQTDPATGEPTNVVAMDSEATARKPSNGSDQAKRLDSAGVDLTITPDADFFTDPSTVYPVTVDPTITYEDPSWDTWVRNGVTTDLSTTTYLEIGTSGGKASRSLVNFKVPELKGATINDATVGFYNYMSASCERLGWEIWRVAGSNLETRWTNQPTWYSRDGAAYTAKGGPTCTAPGFIWVDATPFFQEAANSGRNVAYMGVRATDETSNLTQKRFYSQNYSDTTKSPTATVTYTPDAPDTDFAVVAGNALQVGTEVNSGDFKSKLLQLGYTSAEADQVIDRATEPDVTASGAVMGTPSVADPSDDSLFDEMWAAETGGGTPPAVTPDEPASMTATAPYTAVHETENSDDSTVSANGIVRTGRYGIHSSWRDYAGRLGLIRNGYDDRPRNTGFGVAHLAGKHNLTPKIAKAVMKRPAQAYHVSGRKWQYISYDLHHVKCYWSGIVRRCKSVEKTNILVTHDFRQTPNDGYPMGVITAYCMTYAGKCPNWVKKTIN